MSKECTKCNENLSLDNFQKDFGCADGYRNCCKNVKKLVIKNLHQIILFIQNI